MRNEGVDAGRAKQKRRAKLIGWTSARAKTTDSTLCGENLRIFNLIDQHTNECHSIHADRAIKARAIPAVAAQNEIKTIYIDPGYPWQNGYIESFIDKFRRECLNRELIFTLSGLRVICADYKQLYNYERPHRSLDLLTPKWYMT